MNIFKSKSIIIGELQTQITAMLYDINTNSQQ